MLKRKMEERKAYKASEDAKFWDRKQQLHAKTSKDFGNAKATVEAIHAQNLERGNQYKQELEQMNLIIRQDLARLNELLRELGLDPIDVERLITE